jgi:glycosyltransferase involved in cell wall biosynthesis
MKILFIPSWYPTKDSPLSGTFFREQANALHKNGHEVFVLFSQVISIRLIFKKLFNREENEDFDNFQTLRLIRYSFFPRRIFSRMRIFENSILNFRGYKIIKSRYDFIPNIIHAHSMLYAGTSADYISSKTNIPFLITEHSSGFQRNLYYRNELSKFLFVLSRAKKVITVGPGLKSELNKLVPMLEIDIIPNLVDTEKFKIKSKRKSQNFTFLSIGSLVSYKGFENLLIAFSKLQSLNIQLIIAGDGPDFLKLKNLSKSLNVENRVNFKGRISREKVPELYHYCDAFILTSQVETFGVVFIEAFSTGKPVIATKSGGPDLIVNKDNGILIPINDLNKTVKAMETMISNIHSYESKKIREYCIDNFSEKAIVKKLTKIYSEITC